MLSILVPVYNFDIREFIKELDKQAQSLTGDVEILCYDDNSEEKFKEINRSLQELKRVKYLELPENIGRSKIRNKLAEDSKFEQLLFVDCDSKVTAPDFLQKYLSYSSKKTVVCGGRSYEPKPPEDKSKHFRWYYGTKREIIPAVKRAQYPYKSFMTNNFLIPREVFLSIKFNEDLIGYGHEDTLFGNDLLVRKIPIIHIDNPLSHIGLETTEEFIKKTEEGIRNLSYLLNNNYGLKDVKLLNYYNVAKKLGIASIIFSVFSKQKNNIVTNLQSENPNLALFDLYKLGYLISLNRIN